MAEKRYTIVFAVAIAVAMVATYGVYKVLDANAAKSRVATRAVVVAAVDIPEGGLMERAAVTIAQWPAATVPEGAYTSADSVIGRVTRVAIFKGEVLVPGRLAPLGSAAGIEVKYDQVTAGRFRHGTGLVRWRPDKDPNQCTFDQLKPELRPSELREIFGT